MPPGKRPRTVTLVSDELVWTLPAKPGTDIRTERGRRLGDKPPAVPAIHGMEADGRHVLLTLESPRQPSDRATYIVRMRMLAEALTNEARRLEKEWEDEL
jgi:hypothetical protein